MMNPLLVGRFLYVSAYQIIHFMGFDKNLAYFIFYTVLGFLGRMLVNLDLITVNQFNLAAIKFSVLKVLNIRH